VKDINPKISALIAPINKKAINWSKLNSISVPINIEAITIQNLIKY
jgi:hypothetical protein